MSNTRPPMGPGSERRRTQDASQTLLARLVKAAAHGIEGMDDPFQEHNRRPLVEHLADFRGHLEALNDSPEHVSARLSPVAPWSSVNAALSGSPNFPRPVWRNGLRRRGRKTLPPRSKRPAWRAAIGKSPKPST